MIVNRLLDFLPTTIPGNSLHAATPEDGLELATRLARATRHNLGEDHHGGGRRPRQAGGLPAAPARPRGRHSPAHPVGLSCFAVVAAANDYWR